MSDKTVVDYYGKNPPMPQFAYSDTLNRKIYFAHTQFSEKPLLVLIHGAPGAWFGYKEFFHDSLLLNKFQIIAPDRAGYHNSGEKELSIAQQANFLKPLLSQKKYSKIIVLGRSYGAAIAAKLAADCPNLVSKLILIAPACDPEKEKFWWFSKPVNSKFARFFLPKYANRASDEKFAHQAELIKLLSDWQKIKCPVTILQGGKDWIIDPSNGRFVDSVLTNAPKKFVYLPDYGHLLTSERYELIREVLLDM
ncbi:MAG: alpha/beta hydrolase [Arcicella sp.]|nr:alpha/beta hydrolase [Arcicella sp.]